MSTPAYFSQSTVGDLLLERLRRDYIRALRPCDYGRVHPHYARVQDYDPVLRAHCRLDAPVLPTQEPQK